MSGIRNRHLFFSDALLLAVAPFLLYAARFESWNWTPEHKRTAIAYTLISVPLCLSIFFVAGLYRRLWRYASVGEVKLVFVTGTLAGALCVVLGGFLLSALGLTPVRVPASVLVTGLLFVVASAALPRLMMRAGMWRPSRAGPRGLCESVLIAGAGAAGQMILRELTTHPDLRLEPVGFVDDDASKQGHQLANVPVLGTIEQIPDIARRMGVEMVIIAMPSAPGAVLRQIVRAATDAGLKVRTVPGLSEIISGRVNIAGLREVQIDDLLRREPIQTDLEVVSRFVSDKVVLITGAGGSIGSELCRQLAHFGPAKLVLVGHGENSIFDVTNELRRAYPSLPITPFIADVRDAGRIDRLFALHRPAVVFHAAAHKHVPLMEENVAEAITNNIGGTSNVIDAAVRCGTERFVMISSDKAVRPTNVMGATKRVAELVVRAAAQRHERNFVAVRFGNVLGSRGSVVPIFAQQIRQGGPLTVTHPEVRRYFMTIPEAVQLVLQAAATGRGGELFMLDMGELMRVADLAREMIRLSGLEEGTDIEIQYTGLRPGEKLYEEMLSRYEAAEATGQPKILRTRRADQPEPDEPMIQRLVQCAHQGATDAELRAQLKELVSDFDTPGVVPKGPTDGKPPASVERPMRLAAREERAAVSGG
jgi:FlaA1/EpsC-like NDP-sugar epimerase